MSTSAELENTAVAVIPGGEATTTLAVRNDTDIVEAYEFEVAGDCAPWTTVEPARLSLYPGTRGTVQVRFHPPRSSEVPAGEFPLAVRVVPVERPDLVAVPEGVVHVAAFHQLRAWLAPQRRRGWRAGRYGVVLHNQGNAPLEVPLVVTDPAEELRFRLDAERPLVEYDEQVEVPLRARARQLVWFGRPVAKPFAVTAAPVPAGGDLVEHEPQPPEELSGELAQIPLLPRWLLALLALLLALVLAWFALVRPAVQSAAKDAAENQAREMAKAGELAPPPGQQPENPAPPAEKPPPAAEPPPAEPPGGGPNTAPNGGQISQTVQIRAGGGASNSGAYTVPKGKVLFATDLVLANNQGDEGVLTITFGDRLITRIALETFRNQDYHWVTPIQVNAGQPVRAAVTCDRPGTPANGQQAARCAEVLNVSGILRDAPR